MGTTPKHVLPYPEPTDPVANGATDIKNLSLAIDPKLVDWKWLSGAIVPYGGPVPATAKITIQGGAFTGPVAANGTIQLTYPTAFPTGVITFMAWPLSIAHYVTGAGKTNMTLTYATFYVFGGSGAVIAGGTNIDMTWIAIGW